MSKRKTHTLNTLLMSCEMTLFSRALATLSENPVSSTMAVLSRNSANPIFAEFSP